MSDRRFLDRPNIGWRHPELDEQVKPRSSRDMDTFGNAGRIRKRKMFPSFTKNWYQGYNVQGQQDPLVETLPVGLRSKRACCTWVLLVLLLLANIGVLIGTIIAYNTLNMTTHGPKNIRIKGDDVAFTGDFGAEEIYISANEAVVPIVRTDGTQPTAFESTSNLELRVTSDLQTETSSFILNGLATKLKARSLNTFTGSTDFFNADVERSIITSQQFVMTGDLHANSVSSPLYVSSPASGLNVSSSKDLSLRSFSRAGVQATTGDMGIQAQGDITIATSNLFGPASSLTLKHAGGSLDANFAEMPFPNNVTLAPADEAFRLCGCPDGRTYTSHVDFACEQTSPQYLSDPCA